MRHVSSPTADPPPVDRDDLRECLSAFPIDIAVMFGSVATGKDNALSDLDVAIQFDATVEERGRLLDRVQAAVMETTGRDAIDLVDLDDVGPVLGYEILSNGDLVVGDPDVANELEARFLVRKLDFQPIRERWQRALDRRIEEGAYGRP